MPVYVDNIDKTYSQSITFTPSMKNSAVLYGLIIGFLAAFTIATICFYIIFILRYRRLLAIAGQSPPDIDNIESQRFCFQFHNNKAEGMAGGGGDQMCAVCLSKFDDEDAIRLLPECKHCFHVKCIDKWLLLHSTCPVCRVKTIIMTGEHEKVKGTSPAVNRHGEGDNVGGGHWTARWFWWVAAEAEDVVFEI